MQVVSCKKSLKILLTLRGEGMKDGRKLLILGGTGMLGHKLFAWLSEFSNLDVYATARNLDGLPGFSPELFKKVRVKVDADNSDSIIRAITEIKPDVVINCIGIIKQVPAAGDHLTAISVNALLPHRIALICRAVGARMIHISTDCVFDGDKGNYTESDLANATDLYGQTKFLGEVAYSHCVTLRTSIIGHELKGKYGLVEWFLAQKGEVNGYTNVVFTGVPTVELARIISAYVIPNSELQGLYHVSADAISKYDLLKLIASRYQKQIKIAPANDIYSKRTLNSTLFRGVTGYNPPDWPELVDRMYQDYRKAPYYQNQREVF